MGIRDIFRDCHPRMMSRILLPDGYHATTRTCWNDVIDYILRGLDYSTPISQRIAAEEGTREKVADYVMMSLQASYSLFLTSMEKEAPKERDYGIKESLETLRCHRVG